MFGLRLLPQWTFLRFAVVLLQTIVLYLLLTILVLPSQGGSTTDMRGNFFNQQRWFFGLLVLLLVISVLKDVVISGSLPDAANLLFHAVFLTLAIFAFVAKRETYQLGLAIVSAIGMLAYVVSLFAVLQ